MPSPQGFCCKPGLQPSSKRSDKRKTYSHSSLFSSSGLWNWSAAGAAVFPTFIAGHLAAKASASYVEA